MEINKAINYFVTSLHHAQLSEHTIRAYSQDLYQWAAALTKNELNALAFEDFQEYFIALQASELKITSLRRKRVVIHRFLKFCCQKKLCIEKLYEYIDPIKAKKISAPKEVLSNQEIHNIFEHITGNQEKYKIKLGSSHYDYLYYCSIRNELILYILLYTGCRAAEVVALKKQDIDLAHNHLTILAKGHKYNRIPIHEELLKAIMRYDEHLNLISNSSILKNIEESIYMFPSKQGPDIHLATRTLHELMLKLSEVLSRHIHAHLFRHTFASYCIAANMDIATISSLISHSNPSITLSIYTHEIQSTQKQQEIKKLTFNID
ncbi:MAG: tyrosine-type recombinase/integrase [Cellulosilyticaceae bacterium]